MKYQFNLLKIAGCLCLIFLLGRCKNELPLRIDSESPIRYFAGGSKDKVNAIETTADGGFIYAGYSNADSAKTDAFLMKIDGKGTQQWYKTFGGNRFDEFRHAIQTSDGGFIAVGQTNSIGFGVTDGSYRMSDYIVKLNSNGIVEWTKSFLGVPGCLTNIYETPDHSFLITGYVYPTTYDVILMKMDASGNLLVGSGYPYLTTFPPFNIKNNYNEFGQSISISNDGSIIIGGVMSKSNLIIEAQSHVTFLMKTNQSGIVNFFYPYYNLTRGQVYATSFSEIQRRLATVKIINQNDGYLIGTYVEDPGTQNIKMVLMKCDLTGAELWHKEYSGLGNTLFYDMKLNADGTLLLVGSSSDNSMSAQFPEMFFYLKTILIKVDKDGNALWTKYFGSESNTNFAKCISPLPNGGWSIAGYSCSNESGYDKMNWFEVDNDGNLLK